MSHGQPDFGLYAQKNTVYGLSDMGELAVRLGSIHSYDRRGDIVWADDFELPNLKWTTSVDDPTGYVRFNNTIARSGIQSVALNPGNFDGMNTYMYRNLPILKPHKVGTEISFAFAGFSYVISMSLAVFTGTYMRRGDVRYNIDTEVLDIRRSSVVYTTVDNIDLIGGTSYIHTCKLVIDLETGYYSRLMLDATEYDLSSYTLYSVANTSAPYVQVEIRTLAVGDRSGRILYVDDSLLTQNEP